MKMPLKISGRAASSIWQTLRLILQPMIIGSCLAGMALTFFLNAWSSEDAYITYRIIDNFHQGYGLRWNIYERVQAYTHPLWMLIHLPVYAVWNNIYHVGMAISLVCSVAAVAVALFSVKKPFWVTMICFFMPLALSKCFVDYTSSGLENPLSYLLFAIFGYVMLNKQHSPYFWFYCSLSVALALLNRLDLIIIYGPTLLWLVWVRRHDIRWGQIFLGATPLIAWFAFSFVYYGFFLPNTKYAKLNTGMDQWRYIMSAVHCIKYFIITDTLSAVLLLTPLAWVVYALRKHDNSFNLWLPVCLALGVYYYCVYVFYIGGDYMSGRFYSLPVFISVWLIYAFIPDKIRFDILFCFVCVMLVAYLIPILLHEIQRNCHTCITNKQRLLNAKHTFRGNSLIISRSPLRLRQEGEYMFSNEGKRIAQQNRTKARPMYYIGMAGFYAGTKTPLIDELGLADPLLARLPATKRQNFNIGHMRRKIPFGYNHAATTGDTSRMDDALAKYYDKLRIIISSDNLLSYERLKTIVEFNLGMYDHWRDDYVKRKAR